MSYQYQYVLQEYAEGIFDPSIFRYQKVRIPEVEGGEGFSSKPVFVY